MKIEDFDKAQPIQIEEARPGDMIATSGITDAREVQKVMIERSIGDPPRVWVTYAGDMEATIYSSRTVVFVCMD